MGRQYAQPKEEKGRTIIIFQIFEYLGQQEKEAWDGKDLKKEKMTVTTGVYGLAFIDGPIFFSTGPCSSGAVERRPDG